MLIARSRIIVGAINNHAMVRSEKPLAVSPNADDFNVTSAAGDDLRLDMVHLRST